MIQLRSDWTTLTQVQDTVAVDKVEEKAVAMDVSNDSDIRKTEHVKLEEEPECERTVREDVKD